MKAFLKFFWGNVKDSRVLLLKYLVEGALLFGLTLVANRLQLHDLTYFNAVFALVTMLELVGFGAANGACIYINQNPKDKTDVENNFKFGLVFATVVAALVVAAVVALKDFIFKYVILAQVDDFTFFYIMAPFIFLCVVLSYFYHILKRLKAFKYQLYLVLIRLVPMLLGVLLVVMCGGGSLMWIGIVCNLALLIPVPVFLFWVFKYKLKSLKTNIFQIFRFKVKNFKHKISTMLQVVSIEFIWSIGNVLGFLFILKKSEHMYNAMNYFDKFFQISSAFYYALMIVASIRICTKMGQGRFKECYQNGKFIIYQSIVVWVLTSAMFMAVSPLLLMGLHADLYDIGKQLFWLLMFVQLANWLDWAFASYILPLGGKTKLVLACTITVTIYRILLFIFASHITSNIYVLVALLMADSAFNAVIYGCYFASKRWLVNVNKSHIDKVKDIDDEEEEAVIV